MVKTILYIETDLNINDPEFVLSKYYKNKADNITDMYAFYKQDEMSNEYIFTFDSGYKKSLEKLAMYFYQWLGTVKDKDLSDCYITRDFMDPMNDDGYNLDLEWESLKKDIKSMKEYLKDIDEIIERSKNEPWVFYSAGTDYDTPHYINVYNFGSDHKNILKTLIELHQRRIRRFK